MNLSLISAYSCAFYPTRSSSKRETACCLVCCTRNYSFEKLHDLLQCVLRMDSLWTVPEGQTLSACKLCFLNPGELYIILMLLKACVQKEHHLNTVKPCRTTVCVKCSCVYHRFPRYTTLENKTPTETFPKFPSIIHVIDRSDKNPPIRAR